MLNQQKEVYKGNKVKDCIVSCWTTHIRPMVRGKFPVDVEFGPSEGSTFGGKVLLNLKNNFLFLEDITFNNVNGTTLLLPALCSYNEQFGSFPTQLSADRGFYSQDNQEYCQRKGIKKIALEKKGKPLLKKFFSALS